MYNIMKTEECFKALPNDVAKQVLAQVVNGYFNFFKAIKAYAKNKSGFKAVPKPPDFKSKLKGRNVLTVNQRCCRLKDSTILFNKHLKLNLPTKVDNLVEVKITPQRSCYKIQVCYRKSIPEKVDSPRKLAVDLGINNLCTISNNFKASPIILNGKPLKSINKYSNKLIAKTQSALMKNHGKYSSRELQRLFLKRQCKMSHYLHHCSKYLVDYAVENGVSEIAIGYNPGWKQDVSLGKVTNQTFVQIPYYTFINQIKYKAALQGISVLLNEESYTSKCSALDLESIEKHDEYKGERIKRGLFVSSKNILINADLNGSINIGRKVLGDAFGLSNIGCVVQPVKVTPLQN